MSDHDFLLQQAEPHITTDTLRGRPRCQHTGRCPHTFAAVPRHGHPAHPHSPFWPAGSKADRGHNRSRRLVHKPFVQPGQGGRGNIHLICHNRSLEKGEEEWRAAEPSDWLGGTSGPLYLRSAVWESWSGKGPLHYANPVSDPCHQSPWTALSSRSEREQSCSPPLKHKKPTQTQTPPLRHGPQTGLLHNLSPCLLELGWQQSTSSSSLLTNLRSPKNCSSGSPQFSWLSCMGQDDAGSSCC